MMVKMIEMLRKMGYEVIENTEYDYIRVFLKLQKSNQMLSWTVYYDELMLEGGIERVVREFNHTISRDF